MNKPEYMRVRQHLYNLIDKAGDKDLQIPPENELARLFKVSRVTVRGAIKGLVKDKFLIPKRGMGTFINRSAIDKVSRYFPIVGLLVGNGRHSTEPFAPLLAKCAILSGMRFETLYLPETDSPERFLEMVRSGVDAVIWMHYDKNPVKHITHLAAHGIPTLSVNIEDGRFGQDFDYVAADKSDRGATLAKFLFSRGHRSVLLIHNFGKTHAEEMTGKYSTHSRYCECMDEFCAAAGGQKHRAETMTLAEFEAALKNGGKKIREFTALYALAEVAPYATHALRTAGFSIPNDFSFLCYGDSDSRFFDGLEPTYFDIDSPVKKEILEWFDVRLVKNDRSGRFSKLVEIEINPGQTVRDISNKKISS
ncbi:MAG: GntR family transcriptional regulator [Spirochaetes bacterium]|nr:GntR family transcriptional regulator [Spirochaetota bacterium]